MQIHEIKIEKMVFGGYGLGFIDKRAVFVPYSDAGDFLRIRIVKEKKEFLFGEILDIVEPSRRRITPACENFTLCGGCHYLHLPYETELGIKVEILQDCLRRIGGFHESNIPEISVINDNRFHYRSHASVKISKEGAGFYKESTNELTPFPDKGCLLLHKKIQKIDNDLLERGIHEIRIALDSSGKVHCSSSNEILREAENGIIYQRNIKGFFQANLFLRGKMLEIVKEYSALETGESFLDLFCGIGFFTLFLAGDAKKGAGYDIDKAAVKNASLNSKLNNRKNVKFYSLSSSILNINNSPFNPDLIVVDPPRAGLSQRLRRFICASKAARAVYVSCNPSTFARDAGDLVRGGFIFDKLTFIDMFPSTGHIELIALFKR